ncbi:MAG: hypothetical protein LBS54_03940 [Dysgonamonadaceae bacterium]|jgi:hypothetical protein|nr:hypothetical protein [Dysgonamonadaceae bacterium]
MKIKKLHSALVSNKYVLIIALAAFSVARLNGNMQDSEIIIATIIHAGIALFMIQINNAFNIIRTRTVLPVVIYILLCSAKKQPYDDINGSVTALCVALSYFFMLSSFQSKRAEVQSLNISIIITTGSLIWTPLMLFFPFTWYGFYRMKSWNRRIIPAAIAGYAGVYLVLFAWSAYRGNIAGFVQYLPETKEIFMLQYHKPSVTEWIFTGLTLAIYLHAGFNLYVSAISENIRTIFSLQSIYFPSLFMIIMSFLQPKWVTVLYIPLSIVISYLFTDTKSPYRQYLCLTFIIAAMSIGILEYLNA